MITKMFVLILFICLSKINANVSVATDVNENAFELKLKELGEKLEMQNEINARHETIINSLNNRLESLNLRLNVCEMKTTGHQHGQHTNDWRGTTYSSQPNDSYSDDQSVSGIRQGRQAVNNVTVAFSAYLNKQLSNLGPDHTIHFGGIILNEGNAYNRYTGIFTAPYSGVYLFSYSAEDYHRHRLWLKLVVNGSLMSSIKIYPYSTNYNAMGSNTVILRITAGQSVWIAVDSRESGDYLDGSTELRTTTFSGVFLYQ